MMKQWAKAKKSVETRWIAANRALIDRAVRMRHKLEEVRGQGTTEYAILVGVLVVIAIIAITAFRPKIKELWDAIAQGVNGL